jgi:hypothetical protein
MLPLLKTRLEIGAVVTALAIGLIALHEHDAKIREQAVAQAVVDTQKQVQADADKKISDLAKQMDARDAAYKLQLETLSTRFQTAATPQQLAALATSLMGLKTPIQILSPAPTAQNPNPQPVAQISLADAPQAKAYLQDCEQCRIDRAKLTADAADRQAQANLAQLQIDSLKKENTALAVEVKGGSVLHRTIKALKYIALGAGVGAVALCGSGHCR